MTPRESLCAYIIDLISRASSMQQVRDIETRISRYIKSFPADVHMHEALYDRMVATRQRILCAQDIIMPKKDWVSLWN